MTPTTSERDGVCTKCNGAGYYAGRAEYGPCDCQLPKPQQEAPGAVAVPVELLRQVIDGTHSVDETETLIERLRGCIATPPAPVDVRLPAILKTVIGVRTSIRSSDVTLEWWNRHLLDVELELRTLLDGQQAGVDDAMVERAFVAGAKKYAELTGGLWDEPDEHDLAATRAALQAALGGGGRW